MPKDETFRDLSDRPALVAIEKLLKAGCPSLGPSNPDRYADWKVVTVDKSHVVASMMKKMVKQRFV